MKKFLKKITTRIDRDKYKNKNFVLVSNNCWGAEVYKRLGIQYNTPFVGLFIFAPDYIELLSRFNYYLKQEVIFKPISKWTKKEEKYPIGQLGDIEIHFMHYKSEEEAYSKWNRRLNRMFEIKDLDNFYFKICDRDLGKYEITSKFHDLPFKNKISFSIYNLDNPNHFKIKENDKHLMVPDGVKLYRYSYKYVDILEWVTSGKIIKNYYSKFKSILNIT